MNEGHSVEADSIRKDGSFKPLFLPEQHFGILLLGMFLLNAAWLFDAIVFRITAKPVSLLIHIALLLATIISAFIFIGIYFFKSSQLELKTWTTLLFSGIIFLLFVSVSSTLLGGWSSIAIPFIMKPGQMNDWIGEVTFLAVVFIVLFIFLFIAKTCYLYVSRNTPLRGLGKATIVSLKGLWTHFGLFIAYLGTLWLAFLVLYLAHDWLLHQLQNLLPGIFLAKFIYYLLLTITKTCCVIFVIRMCKGLNQPVTSTTGEATLANQTKVQTSSKKRLPIFALICVLVTILSVVIALPGSIKGVDMLLADIEYRMLAADCMLAENEVAYARNAITAYTKAEADLDSLQKFLLKILKSKGEAVEAPDYGISSKHIFNACLYDDYFNVLLTVDQNKDAYNRGKLADGIKTIPECALWAYGYFKERGMREQELKMFNAVMMSGVFTDRFAVTLGYSRTELKKLLSKADALEKKLNEKKLFQYSEKAKYADLKLLLKDLQKFLYANDASADLYAYAAELAEQTAQGDAEYQAMKESALKYFEKAVFETPEEEADAIGFVTYMLYHSFHNEEAVSFSEKAYMKDSQNTQLALIYANALMENRQHEASNQVLLSLKQEGSQLFYMLAINHLEQDKYEESLAAYDRLEDILKLENLDGENLTDVEFYCYGYLLECINYFERAHDTSINDDFSKQAESFLKVVEMHEQNTLAFQCIMGLKKWFTQQYDASNRHFEWVSKAYPLLAFPDLMMGVNELEKQEVEGIDTTKSAEHHLIRYILKQPETEEAYFCLGYIYKHSDDVTHAKRAFRRVLEILPYPNEDFDEWGIGHHTLSTYMGLKEVDQ